MDGFTAVRGLKWYGWVYCSARAEVVWMGLLQCEG